MAHTALSGKNDRVVTQPARDRRPSRARDRVRYAACVLSLSILGACSSAIAPTGTPAGLSHSPAGATADQTATVAPRPSTATGLVDRVIAVTAPELPLRSRPATSGDELLLLRAGQRLRVVGGPVVAEGTDWYEVRIGPGTTTGWVPAGAERDALALVEDGVVAGRCDGTDCPEGPGVYLADIETGELGPRVGGEDVGLWSWSPDGTRLAFALGEPGSGRFAVVNADGSGAREISTTGVYPIWSPDGMSLAWPSGGSLWVAGPDLVPREVLRIDAEIQFLEWSPDGRRLAFVEWICPGCPDQYAGPAATGAMWTVGVDGSGLSRIPDTERGAVFDWAPDGSRLSVTFGGEVGEELPRAYLLAVADGKRTPVFEDAEHREWVIWSPDGTMLAVATADGIRVADGDGSNPRLLVPADDEHLVELRWAPSGRSLLYWALPPTGGAASRVADATTGDVREVLGGLPSLRILQWQPILEQLP